MSPVRTRVRIPFVFTVIAVVVVLSALLTGHPAIAEVTGGAVLLWVAVLSGSLVIRRIDAARDAGTKVRLDLLLIGVILLGLVGVAVMALAIP